VGQVPVGVTIGRDALVDLQDDHARPVELSLAEALEHPPRRVASADRERERATLADRRVRRLRDQLGAARRRRL
jgi:hypothetical protein